MYFVNNGGDQGACYLLDSNSVLTDNDSVYHANRAMQGGVVYAINDSRFHFMRGRFRNNIGNDGAIVYSMYNSNERALSFSDCQFE